VLALDALARLAAERGETDEAERRLGEADRLAAQAQHLVDEADRYDARLARDVLGTQRP
jgi:hypothetical protein